jgi:Cu-processing system permease protein
MRGRAEVLSALAMAEFRGALQGRFVQGFGLLFAALSVGIAIAGLSASGQLLVQGFVRSSASLLTLSVYLLPLLGLVLGASAFGSEDGGTELMLAQPIRRGDLIAGRTLGLALALMSIAAAGFGIAALLVGATAGTEGLAAYAAVAAMCTGVGLFGLSLGVCIGVLSRRRLRAIGGALGGWVLFAVVFDLAAIAVLQLSGSREPGPWLLAVLLCNPIDGTRTLGLVTLGADVLLGPTGAAMQELLGANGGGLAVLASLVLWSGVALAIAVRRYQRQDF